MVNTIIIVSFCFIISIMNSGALSSIENIDNPIYTIVRRTLYETAHSCMDQAKANETDLEKLKLDPPFPGRSACVVVCILEKIGIVKDKKYSKTGFMSVVTPLVARNKKKLERMKVVSENCDKEVTGKQQVVECQLGSDVVQCVYKYAPELRFTH